MPKHRPSPPPTLTAQQERLAQRLTDTLNTFLAEEGLTRHDLQRALMYWDDHIRRALSDAEIAQLDQAHKVVNEYNFLKHQLMQQQLPHDWLTYPDICLDTSELLRAIPTTSL